MGGIRIPHLGPDQLANIVETYLRVSSPDIRKRAIKLLEPVIQQYRVDK